MLGFLKKAVKQAETPRKKRPMILCFVIDMSGSMDGTEVAMMPTYDDYMQQRATTHPDTQIFTILFNSDIRCVCNGKPVKHVPKLNYNPSGSTSMFDGFAHGIEQVNQFRGALPDDDPMKNADVLYIFKTDGYENSSTRFNETTIKPVIQNALKSTMGKDVRNLSADTTVQGGRVSFIILNEFCIDGALLAQTLGLPADNVQMFFRDKEGMDCVFKAIDIAVSIIQEQGAIYGDEFKIKSGRIKYGRITLSEIEKETKELREALDLNEKEIARFEKVANESGLTVSFKKDYDEFLERLERLSKYKKKFQGTMLANLVEQGIKRQQADGRRIMKYALNQEIREIGKDIDKSIEAFSGCTDFPLPSISQFETSCMNHENKISGLRSLIEDTMTRFKFFSAGNRERTMKVVKTHEDKWDDVINDVILVNQTRLIGVMMKNVNCVLFGQSMPIDDSRTTLLKGTLTTCMPEIVKAINEMLKTYEFWSHLNMKSSKFGRYPSFEGFRKKFVSMETWKDKLERTIKACGVNGFDELSRYGG